MGQSKMFKGSFWNNKITNKRFIDRKLFRDNFMPFDNEGLFIYLKFSLMSCYNDHPTIEVFTALNECNIERVCYSLFRIEQLLKDISAGVKPPKMFSSKELAQFLRISQSKVINMAIEKTIPHYRAGNRYIFDFEQVMESIRVRERAEAKRKMRRIPK